MEQRGDGENMGPGYLKECQRAPYISPTRCGQHPKDLMISSLFSVCPQIGGVFGQTLFTISVDSH